MPLGLEDKKRIVAEVNEAAGAALSAVLADYRGVAVQDMTALRRNARENQVYLRVVRNSALSIGGRLLGPGDIEVLAKMPTLDQARAMLMSVLLAPAVRLARTLNEVPARLTRTVAAVREQKQQAA